MKEIYLIRHGQTLYNVQKRVQGRGVDSSLDEIGGQQAQAFFEHYKQQPFELVITSSLKRTIETVSPFLDLGIAHWPSEDLDEISWGIYEGQLSSEEMHQEYKRVLTRWGQGIYEARISEGETALEIQTRLHRFLRQLLLRPEKNILICTHGGSLAFLMTMLQGQPLSAMTQYKHQNTGLCKFSFDGERFMLQMRDDTRHLAKLSDKGH